MSTIFYNGYILKVKTVFKLGVPCLKIDVSWNKLLNLDKDFFIDMLANFRSNYFKLHARSHNKVFSVNVLSKLFVVSLIPFFMFHKGINNETFRLSVRLNEMYLFV